MGIGEPSPDVIAQIFRRHGTRPPGHAIVGSGDLVQMSTWRSVLLKEGFEVAQEDVYTTVQEKDLARALKLLWERRIDGWWNLALVEKKIVTQEEFEKALKDNSGRPG